MSKDFRGAIVSAVCIFGEAYSSPDVTTNQSNFALSAILQCRATETLASPWQFRLDVLLNEHKIACLLAYLLTYLLKGQSTNHEILTKCRYSLKCATLHCTNSVATRRASERLCRRRVTNLTWREVDAIIVISRSLRSHL